MNLPIGLTITRIAFVPLLILFLISSSRVHALIAAAIFIAAAITDWADGFFARRRNEVTTLGTLLDPIADKLLVAAALVSLLQIGKVDAWIVVVIIGRELAVTGLRAVAASVGVIVSASRLAKWKTVSQYVAITMLIIEKGVEAPDFHVAAMVVLWAALALTVMSAVGYFYRVVGLIAWALQTGADVEQVKRAEETPAQLLRHQPGAPELGPSAPTLGAPRENRGAPRISARP